MTSGPKNVRGQLLEAARVLLCVIFPIYMRVKISWTSVANPLLPLRLPQSPHPLPCPIHRRLLSSSLIRHHLLSSQLQRLGLALTRRPPLHQVHARLQSTGANDDAPREETEPDGATMVGPVGSVSGAHLGGPRRADGNSRGGGREVLQECIWGTAASRRGWLQWWAAGAYMEEGGVAQCLPPAGVTHRWSSMVHSCLGLKYSFWSVSFLKSATFQQWTGSDGTQRRLGCS